jgi:hypothetical protein
VKLVRRLALRAAVFSLASLLPLMVGCPLGPAADASPWGDPTASRSWALSGSPGFSGGSYFTSIAFDAGGKVYAAIQEYDSGLNNARVMWDNAGTWEDLSAAQNVSGGAAVSIQLAIDRAGVRYIAYCVGYAGAVQVRTFDGTNWVDLSPPLTTSGLSPALAFDQSDNLYIAFSDVSNGSVLTVEKWNGSTHTWSVVGGVPVSTDTVDSVSMGIDGLDHIFVAYEDSSWGNQGSAFVWDGTAWSRLGPQGFTGSSVASVSLAIDLYGNPWVAYMDAGVGEKATVMEYTGGSWGLAGKRGFSSGWAGGLRLAISPSGTPYVAYSDQSLGDSAAVMVLRGTTWMQVGKNGFSPGASAYVSLAIGQDGQVAVAFQDRANHYDTTVMEFR